ncbi:hypothetical protein IG631_05046 [Alternaria alternata]|nr:hypothetical protein IG631_05046 [Alternaria alternata]
MTRSGGIYYMVRYLCTATEDVKYISPIYTACSSAVHYQLGGFRSCKKILPIKGGVAPEATLSATTASTTTIIAPSTTLTSTLVIKAVNVDPTPYLPDAVLDVFETDDEGLSYCNYCMVADSSWSYPYCKPKSALRYFRCGDYILLVGGL